jgi:pimeloyl-ACP methyl ester carboxylesterase
VETVRCGEVRLSCTIAGPEDGPLMVLLHGFPEFGGSWRRAMVPLAEAGFRVVAPDQRGYGRSDKPPKVSDYGMDHLAGDIDALIRAMGHEQASVVGHDWGGAVAWWLAMTEPTRVSRLVTLNVPHPEALRRTLFSNLEQLRRAWYMFAFQLPGLPEHLLLRDGGRGLYARLVEQSGNEAFPPADRAAYVGAWTQPGAMRGMLNWYRAAMRTQLPDALPGGLPGVASARRVVVPTMILWGRDDEVLVESLASDSLDWCDEGSLRFFDAGHFVQHEERDEVVADLVRFCGPATGA